MVFNETNCIELFSNIGIDIASYDLSQTLIFDVCDSLQFIALVCDLEDKFCITIPDSMLSENNTIQEFIDKIKHLHHSEVAQ